VIGSLPSRCLLSQRRAWVTLQCMFNIPHGYLYQFCKWDSINEGYSRQTTRRVHVGSHRSHPEANLDIVSSGAGALGPGMVSHSAYS
jgi:hypothetical protein